MEADKVPVVPIPVPPVKVVEKKVDPHKFDVNTVVYFMYLMYKCNMLTRNHLNTMFRIIKEDTPGDVMKYLVEEGLQAS